MSDYESDLEDELQAAQDVELGFVVAREDEAEHAHALRLHADADWSRWDGGKVGGRPSWLVPARPPAPQCAECAAPLALLLQIYCPLDDEDDAFHRSLYVFVCREPSCARMGDGRVLRAQLPRENAFYVAESGGETPARDREEQDNSCALCGQRAVFTCSKCHVARYCCKNHQRDHWTAGGHKADCEKCAESGKLVQSEAVREKLRTGGSAWLFPEYALEIDHEPDASEAVDEHEAKLIAEFEKNKSRPKPSSGESDPFSDDSAIDVTQNELNEAIGASGQDKQYVKFLTRVALAKDQVLRYARWQEESVLWVHEAGTREPDSAPPCQRCGSARKFEFQVLPQLLFYLKVDQQSSLSEIKKRSVDWGTLAVYTCKRSCPLDAQYAEEFLHYQPPYAGN